MSILLQEAVLVALALNIMFALSFHLTYLTGQLSFGHAAFASIGAYMAGVLTTRLGLPVLWAMAAAMLAGLAAGCLVALIALRTRHVNLAILTFGIMQIVAYGLGEWDYVGGLNGLTGMTGIGLTAIVPVAVAVVLGSWWLEQSHLGLAMRAVRRDELAASLMGIAAAPLRVLSFGIGAAVAGLAGALYGHYNFFVDPNTFGLGVAVNMVFSAIVGGTQVWLGPVVGAILLTLLPELLRDAMTSVDIWRPVLNSAIIVVMLIVRPEGLIRRSSLLKVAQKVRRQDGRNVPALLPIEAAGRHRAVAEPALTLAGLSKSFGGIVAIAGIDLQIPSGQVFGLIGPNGAGKTTIFNLITGVYRPSSGRITTAGHDITGLPPATVARRGVARTFQNIRLFGDMTVAENIAVAQHGHAGVGIGCWLPRQQARNRRLRDEADRLLQLLNIHDVRDRFATELPYATQRRVEFARALALDPAVLLLDEPTAGMDHGETDEIADIIRLASRHFGCTIILVEHDMSLVMAVCDRIAVLNFGQKIAEGTPAEIQADLVVQQAYLGQEVAA